VEGVAGLSATAFIGKPVICGLWRLAVAAILRVLAYKILGMLSGHRGFDVGLAGGGLIAVV